MRNTHIFLMALVSSVWLILHAPPLSAQNEESGNRQQAYFIENKGQITYPDGSAATDVLFTLHSGNFSAFIFRDGISYQFTAPDRTKNDRRNKIGPVVPQQEETEYTMTKGVHRMDVRFAGANPAAQVTTERQTGFVSNYYIGNAMAVTQARAFGKITIQDVYPGIDWTVYVDEGKLKYDFVVMPGADPSVIQMVVDGADDIRRTSGDEMIYVTRFGAVTDGNLFCYQDYPETARKAVMSQFVQKGNRISIAIGAYDPSETLVIDPALEWSSFYGGFGEDAMNGMTADADSNIIFTGYTASENAIAYLGYQNTYLGGTYDAYVVKMDGAGNRIWATYFGGKRGDFGTSVVTNANNEIYVSGFAFSTNFITTAGAYQTGNAGDYDAFLVKLSESGALIFSTLFGGTGGEFARSVALDQDNDVYISGSTSSSSGIASGGWQNIHGGGSDQFLAKFTSTGGFLWSTYLGGPNDDYSRDVSVDANNDVYLAGYSNSSTGIAYNAFDSTWQSNYDCTLAKYDASGLMQWATYYGGNGEDNGNGVAFDADNNVYLAIQTGTGTGLGFNGMQMANGGSMDGMLIKFNPAGDRIWATYYGGFWEDMFKTVQVEGDAVYVVGHAMSAGLGLYGYENMISGYRDGLLCRFDTAGTLIWATYAGGFFDEFGRALTVLDAHTLYWGGKTFSYDFPSTYGSYQMAYGGGIADAFVQKVSDCPVLTTFYADDDGDGFGDAAAIFNACSPPAGAVADNTDCDDNDDAIHPASTEICNFIDDDCNGLTDDDDPGITGQPVWYADADSDDYGDAAAFIVSCLSPPGFISIDGDCDDTNALINPAAPEICNLVDDDCDGSVDEDVAFVLYYPDQDGDGYGDADSSIISCTGLPMGFVPVGTDCNDLNAAIYPGAIEICNTLDDDCDALIDESVVSALVTPAGPTVFCKGSSVVLQANTGVGLLYQWRKNGVNIAGATTANYTATKSGNYSVVVSVAGGCSATSAAVSVTVNSKPNPVITPMGDTDICVAGFVKLKVTIKPGDTYQWYKDGVVIGGATTNVYNASTTGSFYVRQTSPEGCFKNSAPVVVTSSCKNGEVSGKTEIAISPNPASSVITVSWNVAQDQTLCIIELRNTIGQLIVGEQMVVHAGQNTLQLNIPDHTADGTYFLVLRADAHVWMEEVMIVR